MSILEAMEQVLAQMAADEEYPFSGGVYYGICTADDLTEWNYFVFARTEEEITNDKSATSHYVVDIVHEDYVKEGFIYEVIRTIKEAIPGLSVAGRASHTYDTKGKTSVRVEMVTIPFKKAGKQNV